jgi:hypothetical protein
MVKRMVDKIDITIKSYKGNTVINEDTLTFGAGEVLNGLLKIDENPTKAVAKAIAYGLDLKGMGKSFAVQSKQAPSKFDRYKYESIK